MHEDKYEKYEEEKNMRERLENGFSVRVCLKLDLQDDASPPIPFKNKNGKNVIEITFQTHIWYKVDEIAKSWIQSSEVWHALYTNKHVYK